MDGAGAQIIARCDDRPDLCSWEVWNDQESTWLSDSNVEVSNARCFVSDSDHACISGNQNIF